MRSGVAILALSFAVALSAQAPQVLFRSEANFVEVHAVVTDDQGRPVPNLTAADFAIFEDGAAQQIGAFGVAEAPTTPQMTPTVALPDRDVQSNIGSSGRVYLLVLDAYHTDRSRTDRVKAAARQFIERALAPSDVAAVMQTTDQADGNQWFTNSSRLLLASIDRFSGRQLRPSDRAPQAAPPADDAPQRETPDDPVELERASHARSSLNTLHKLADAMADVRGRRKAVIFFSEGIDYDTRTRNNVGSASLVSDAFGQAVGATAAAGVSIYAIDPRSLGAPTADMSSADNGLARESLQSLADQTGGFAVLDASSFASAFERVVADNSVYYVLGYRPAIERRDGRFHRIDVRVNRPGVRVRARSGYLAPGGRAPARGANPTVTALNQASVSVLPLPGIPMTVFASPYKDTAANAAVLLFLELPPAYFADSGGDASAKDTLEVALSAFDGNGALKAGKRHTFNLALTSHSIDDAKGLGFRILSQLQVPPGRYQLRIASADGHSAAAGNVLYDLDVPDFYKAPLSMSGISVYSWPEGPARLSVGAPAPMQGVLPFPPTMQRAFTRNDQLSLFAEIYENAGNAPAHTIEITTTLRDASGRIVAQDREERSSAEPKGHRGEHGLQARIPLKDAEPGRYVIHMEAVARNGNNPRVARDIGITVR